jgi:hypothetical protein
MILLAEVCEHCGRSSELGWPEAFMFSMLGLAAALAIWALSKYAI